MVTTRGERVDGAFTQLVLHGVQPGQGFLGSEAVIGQEGQRPLQEGQRFPAVLTLHDDVAGYPAFAGCEAGLDQDAVTNQLFEAAFLNTEQTAHLVGG